MKKHNYLVALVETAKQNANTFRLTATTALMVVAPTVTALASEPAKGTNLLDGEMMTLLQSSFSNLAVTVTAVVSIAAVTGFTIIGLTAAVKYGMKKVKGTIAAAS